MSSHRRSSSSYSSGSRYKRRTSALTDEAIPLQTLVHRTSLASSPVEGESSRDTTRIYETNRVFGEDNQSDDGLLMHNIDLTTDIELADKRFHAKNASRCSNPGKKCRCIGMILWVILTLILLILCSVFVAKKPEELQRLVQILAEKPASDICNDAKCVMSAARILDKMDFEVNPCQDFYQYSCGKWIEEHPVPEDKSRVSQFDVINDETMLVLKRILESNDVQKRHNYSDTFIGLLGKSRSIYDSCMNVSRIDELALTPLHNVISEFLRQPATLQKHEGDDRRLSESELVAFISFLHKRQIAALFDVYVSTSSRNPGQHAFYISQPKLGLPAKEDYNDQAKVTKYTAIVHEFFEKLIGRHREISRELLTWDRGGWWSVAEEITEFEQGLAQHFWKMEDLKDPMKTNHTVTLADLQNHYDVLPWDKYFSRTVNETLDGKLPNLNATTIFLVTPSYFSALRGLLRRTHPRIVRNYFVWSILKNYSPTLPDSYRHPYDRLVELVSGKKTRLPRWQECVRFSNQITEFILGKVFVDQVMSKSLASIENIVDDVRSAFRSRLHEIEWLDEQTRRNATIKEASMHQKIAYPEFLRNETYMIDRYSKLQAHPTDYLVNTVNAEHYAYQRNIQKILIPVDPHDWSMSPQTVNAYYSSSKNEIVFPAALFQPPFFDETTPLSMHYGGIASVIGHELTHGFDNNGRMFDEQGRLNPWWQPEAAARFQNRSQCFIDQYKKYEVLPGKFLNSKLTLGENIADNGGLSLAWRAYKTRTATNHTAMTKLPGLNMTSDQLFFLSFAQMWCSNIRPEQLQSSLWTDPHAPPSIRVRAATANIPAFQDAFSCPADKNKNICQIW